MLVKYKRILLVLLFMLFSFSVIYAADMEVGSVNYFEPLIDCKEYGELLRHVFDGGDINESMNLYAKLVQAIPGYHYERWLQDLSLARACLIIGKQGVDCDREDVAEAYYKAADGLIADARVHGAPESAAGVLEALSYSFWYLLDGSISKGMKFTSIIDDLWKEHPEDFHVLLMKADRYLHSPGIAGGNKKKGLQLFQEAEAVLNENGAAEWDTFTIYSGLAVGYYKNKDKELALEYALKANEIYKADPNVNEILEDLG